MGMNPDGLGLAGFVVGLAFLMLFLRVKFPNATKAAETAVLLIVTILFFSGCTFFLRPHIAPALQGPSADTETHNR